MKKEKINQEKSDKSKNYSYFFKFLGILFVLLGISAMIESFISKNPFQILWMCYFGIIIIGIGVFRKNSYLVISQLNILAIPLIIWNIDFFSVVFTNTSLFGITDYFFQGDRMFISTFINSQHLFTIPLSVIALYLMGIKKNSPWKLSIAQITAFFVFIRFFTPVEKNINYVFKPFSLAGNIPANIYPVVWFLALIMVILITNLFFMSLRKFGFGFNKEKNHIGNKKDNY